MSDLASQIAGYAFRYWKRHGMTEWPSVARTARALGVRQSEIEEASNGYDDFQLTQYYCHPPQPLGEHSVEAMTPDVDRAWCEYWRPMNADRCSCGLH